ncbi:MAG TPA: hypothetical protein VGE26_02705 [Sphingobacteriaceae bacterium]
MAGFTNQIKARYKAKFPKANLSAAKLDAIIARVDAKTETDDETAIDAALDAINEYTPFEEMAREEDRLRDLESKVKKPKTADPKAPEPDPAPAPADMPEWAKGLVSGIQTLTSELTAIKSEKATTTRREQLAEKLKDAPESYRNKILKDFGRMKFDTDESFNEYLTESEEDFKAFEQEQSNLGLGKDKPFGGGGGNTKGEASQAEIDAVFKDLKI